MLSKVTLTLIPFDNNGILRRLRRLIGSRVCLDGFKRVIGNGASVLLRLNTLVSLSSVLLVERSSSTCESYLTRRSRHSLFLLCLTCIVLSRYISEQVPTPTKSVISFQMRYLTNRTMLGESKHSALFRYVSIRAN